MKTIHKFALCDEHTKLAVPEGSTVVKVERRFEGPYAWVLLERYAPKTRVVAIDIIGTGQAVPEGAAYLSTYFEHDGVFVWHVFVTYLAMAYQ